MKKTKRLFSFILILAIMSTILTACTSDELSLLSTINKLNSVKSYNSTSQMWFNVNSQIPDEFNNIAYSHINFRTILNNLNNYTFTMKQAYNKKDDLNLAAKLDFNVKTKDTSFDFLGYVKSDNGNIVETFQIPTVLRWILPQDKMNAEYFTIDLSSMNKFMGEMSEENGVAFPNMNYSGIIEKANGLSNAYIKFQTDYAKRMTTSPKLLTKTGNAYKITLTDESLKLFMRAMVDTYFKDQEAREDVKTFVAAVIDYYDSMSPGLITDEIKATIYSVLEGVFANEEVYQMEIGKIFETLNQIPILGQKGIEINITLDKNGFVNKVDGFVDLYADINKIAKVVSGNVLSEKEFFVNLTYNFKTEISNINGKVDTSFPTLTKENNIDYVELMKNIIEKQKEETERYREYRTTHVEPVLPAEDGSISVIKYGMPIDFGDTKPELIDGSLYVPLNVMCDEYGYLRYFWSWDDNCAVIERNGYFLSHSIGTNSFNGESYDVVMKQNSVDLNGQVYVPLRSFANSFLGQNVTWVEEENAAHLGYMY